MTITQALQLAVDRAGWSVTRIADRAGVREAAARTWLNGTALPRAEALMALRRELPGFADLLDGKAVA